MHPLFGRGGRGRVGLVLSNSTWPKHMTQLIDLTKKFVHTVPLSMRVNGQFIEYFKLTRGII
jgi:hypothetical protein